MGREVDGDYVFAVGEKRFIQINATSNLASGETISSVEATDDDGLSVTAIAANTAEYTDDTNKRTVAVGKAIEFFVEGGEAGQSYTMEIKGVTSAGQTLLYDIPCSWR